MPERDTPTTIDTHTGPFLFQTHAAALASRMRAAHPPWAVVDARDAAAYARGRIPGAVRVDGRDLGALPKGAEGAAEIFVVGAGPNDASRRRLALALVGLGVRRVTELPGGMAEWEQLGLPVEKGEPGERGA